MNKYFCINRERLKTETARSCLSFRGLAKRAGVSPETVTRIYRANDKVFVNTETIGKLARALNVDVLDLVQEG